MLTLEQATKNIAQHARRATKTQWRKGSVWYLEAHTFCTTLATHENFPVESVVGVLAALSPQCAWSENLLGTISMVRTRRIGKSSSIYPLNASKAFSIAHEGVTPTELLGGEKVKAFYHNILKPRHSKVVTVDTHAARAAFGKHVLTAQESSFVFRPKGNKLVQEAYRQVAKRYKILPCKLQAIVWLRVKADLAKREDLAQLNLYVK